MITRLLIANRGEIACRVIATAKKRGIHTIAIYSTADANAMHVKLADEGIYVGEAPAKESYLKGDLIIEIAKANRIDAIHPGYGFLSENANFARACEANNIIFIGPGANAIDAMGSKSAAKRIMEQAGVPLVPGYHGEDQKAATLKAAADNMGYPVLLKAAAGGGGKGMRQVENESEFLQCLVAAKRESMSSFGDNKMLVEKYLTQPRHVEFQVFCDTYGNGVYLFERDCSVQRRHQKIIEEAPAPGLPSDLRQKMGLAALEAAKAIQYVGAGTVEFLLDTDGSFYFMEMNTRLQVEHPVTEMITQEDLVDWQIRVAQGEPLPKTQDELSIQGHAFEARIYAEDPYNNFLPVTGTLHTLRQPNSETGLVRVDTGVQQGDEVSVYYDPMIAKLVVWGTNRQEALCRLNNALANYHIDGVTTNIDFLHFLTQFKPFVKAQLSTTFIDQYHNELLSSAPKVAKHHWPIMAFLALSAHAENKDSTTDPTSPWHAQDFWRANTTFSTQLELDIGGSTVCVQATHQSGGGTKHNWIIKVDDQQWDVSGSVSSTQLDVTINGVQQKVSYGLSSSTSQGIRYVLFSNEGKLTFTHHLPELGNSDNDAADKSLTAPMNGTVVALLCETGTVVSKSDPILVLEAMKMEHTLTAPCDGVIEDYLYQVGDLVDGGANLVEFSPRKSSNDDA